MIGDRVRLRRDIARARTIGCDGRSKKVNWIKRTGVVVRTGKPGNAISGGNVGVIWDGNRAFDFWPEKALEKICGKSSSS